MLQMNESFIILTQELLEIQDFYTYFKCSKLKALIFEQYIYFS
ncbi:hypothetical protein Niako_3850 [Niastella koreensis GR20-10]|uniref:Uncharacterized protein n=1 Tax=Niastella koreensis (strain DSM 17620 / KACC 11465 / NBRC 106392 / GR20-10) TaxID=700598 RepID=G8T8H1_NIAKG|nr:hypothetical protein Niako_3850 [Niastella koreensis GR20-10]